MPFSNDMRQRAGLTQEDQLAQQILAWQKNPTKQGTDQLLQAINPIVERAISAHAGQSNPLIRSRARRMAIEALRRYHPSKAKTSTFLFGQLHGLRRVARQQQQIMSVPERVSLEQGRLARISAELQDEFGREPDDDELADRSGMAVSRIRNLRQYGSPVAEGQMTDRTTGQSLFRPAVAQEDNDAWLDFVRSDLDPVNRKIMDHTLGRHGASSLSNQDLASKLKLTPGAISQRKAQIQSKLDLEGDLSPFGG